VSLKSNVTTGAEPERERLNPDEDPRPVETFESRIAPGVRRHFEAEEIQVAKNWATQHEEVAKDFDQSWLTGNYDPYLERKTFALRSRQRLSLLQLVVEDGDREAYLGAFIEWLAAGMNERCLGRLAKKYDLADIRHSLRCVEVFLRRAQEELPDFDPLIFVTEATEHFEGLLKDASWRRIQLEEDDDLETTEDWSGLQSPTSNTRKKRLTKRRDRSGYGALNANSVMGGPSLLSAPSTCDRSSFGPWPQRPDSNSAVVPADISGREKQAESRTLENGLIQYLERFAPGVFGPRQREYVTIVDMTQQGRKRKEIADRLGLSEKTIGNRVDELKEMARTRIEGISSVA
jgi:hypothetical protein